MESFIKYLKEKIEGCDSTKAPYRDKIIYQLVLDEYTQQLSIHDVSQQREKLLAFGEYLQKWSNTFLSTQHLKQEVDNYLKREKLFCKCGMQKGNGFGCMRTDCNNIIY